MSTLSEKINTRIDDAERIRAEASRLCDPAYEAVVCEEVQAEQHAEYLERRRQEDENRRLLKEMEPILTLDPSKEHAIREQAAEERSRERQERRRQEEETQRRAAEIAEQVLETPGHCTLRLD